MTGFGEVAALAEGMAATGSRLKKRAEIAAAVGRVQAAGAAVSESSWEAGLFCQYLAGLPFAEADPRKLNAGGALLTRAVFAVTGAAQAELTVAYRRHGDMGSAAFDLYEAHGVGGAGVSLAEVREQFGVMATARTTAIRAAAVDGLLRAATAVEAKYLLKLMLGDMRIGVKQSLVEEAIGVAAGVNVAAVRHAVMLEADLAGAVTRAFAGTLGEARMRLFHPLGFMLASPVETPEEAVERFTAKPVKVVAAKPAKKAAAKKGAGRRKKGEAEDSAMAEVLAEDAAATMVESLGEAAQSGEADALLAEEAVVEGAAAGPVQAGVHAYLEDKYDGMRAQVHCGAADQPGRVAIYSRNREDITESFPELVVAFAQVSTQRDGALDTNGYIFDGEILGWDYAGARALPFAVLGQRIGRKRVTDEWRRQVPVVFMAFDLMYADGELTLGKPLRERRSRLERAAEELVGRVVSPLEAGPQVKGGQGAMFAEAETATEMLPRLMLSPAKLVESAEEIDRAYADARARANEGVMLKAAGSVYLTGRRGLAWVKLKRELATLDVVITGAEYGSGRKAPFLSDYTFAVRDDAGELKNVGKAYSGVTDAEIAELTEFLKEHTLEDHGHFRTVEPLVVLEVAFNNVMRSDRHASGFALRFPRILRIRQDKPLSEIDTVARVEEVYQSQVDKPQEAAQEEQED